MKIFVSVKGSGQKCSQDAPCSTDEGLSRIKANDSLNFCDHFLNSTNDIEIFRNTTLLALQKEINIDGNEITIDGSNIEYFYPSFLFIDSINKFKIANIQFTNFKSPIIHVRNSSQSLIENISLQNSKIVQQFGFITFASSNIVVKNISIHKSTAKESSIITIHNSNIDFDGLFLYQNFLFHALKNPMIMIVNSSVKFLNSHFEKNSSPYSPFISSESNSNISILKSKFTYNHHSEFFLIEDYNNLEFDNLTFYDNKGSLVVSFHHSNIKMREINVDTMSSFKYPLVYNQNSLFSIESSYFTNIDSSFLSLSRGIQATTTIYKSQFIKCKPKKAVIAGRNNAAIKILFSLFSNSILNEGVVSSAQSTVEINDTLFSRSFAPAISISHGTASIFNSTFESSSALNNWAIFGDKGNITVRNSYFNDSSLRSLIHNTGKTQLSRLTFLSPKEYSLSNALSQICVDCKFGEKNLTDSSDYIMLNILFMIFICFIIAFAILKRKKLKFNHKLL